MAANQQNGLKTKRKEIQPTSPTQQQRQQVLQRDNEFISLDEITFSLLFRKLRLLLVNKVFVLIKYQFHRLTFGAFENARFPWFKVGFLALAIFILTKKNLHFAIQMDAPLAGMVKPGTTQPTASQNELSLAQAINFKTNSSSSFPPLALEDLNERQVQAYIQRFTTVAQAEQQKYNIPASVKMAQAILESHAGELEHTRQTNNHFGSPMANQSYNSAWENWRLHSERLTQAESPFSKLVGETSPKKWANGFQELGYSQDKNYAEKLLTIIEKYQLTKLD